MNEADPLLELELAERKKPSLGGISTALSLTLTPAMCLLYFALLSAKSLVSQTFEVNLFSAALIGGGVLSLAGFILAGMAVISPKSKSDFRLGLVGVFLNVALACVVGFLLVFGMTLLEG